MINKKKMRSNKKRNNPGKQTACNKEKNSNLPPSRRDSKDLIIKRIYSTLIGIRGVAHLNLNRIIFEI